MGAKLGPLFAIKVKYNKELTEQACLQPHEWLFEMSDSPKLLLLENYSKDFGAFFDSQSEDVYWVYLAQVFKEDEERLFAFKSTLERSLFYQLKELSSVGPKTAALACSALGPDILYNLYTGVKSLKSVKVTGLGPKTLEKILQGMKSSSKKFDPIFDSLDIGSDRKSLAQSTVRLSAKTAHSDSIQPFMQLGLKEFEAAYLLEELLKEDSLFEQKTLQERVQVGIAKWAELKQAQKSPVG